MHTCVQLRQHRVTGTTSFKFLRVMVDGPRWFPVSSKMAGWEIL